MNTHDSVFWKRNYKHSYCPSPSSSLYHKGMSNRSHDGHECDPMEIDAMRAYNNNSGNSNQKDNNYGSMHYKGN